MAALEEQSWTLYRHADGEIVLSGSVAATGWTLECDIGTDPTAVPALTITPTISTTTITIPFTYAQMTSTLTGREYLLTLWRKDSGSRKPLATGKILLPVLLHPV